MTARGMPVRGEKMKCVFPIPDMFLDKLKQGADTGMGYQVVSIKLLDGRNFDQVLVSECCVIEVRGHAKIPFTSDQLVSVQLNHKAWNFRDGSDARVQARRAGTN